MKKIGTKKLSKKAVTTGLMQELFEAAIHAQKHAHAPYSHRYIGAAVLMAGIATMAQADNLVATLNNVSPGVSATISIDGGGSSFGVNGGLFNWT